MKNLVGVTAELERVPQGVVAVAEAIPADLAGRSAFDLDHVALELLWPTFDLPSEVQSFPDLALVPVVFVIKALVESLHQDSFLPCQVLAYFRLDACEKDELGALDPGSISCNLLLIFFRLIVLSHYFMLLK